MTGDRDELPEGVINADPAGGWESGSVADGETADAHAREASEASAPSVTDSASGEATASDDDDVAVPDGFVESAEIQQGLDPDLRTDDQADR